MAQFGLGMAHGPFLEDAPKPGPSGDGLIRHTGFQTRGIRVLKLLPPYLVMVVDHAQANGICLLTHRIQNGLGPIEVAIGPYSHDTEFLVQKPGFQLVIVFGRALTYTENGFHDSLPLLFCSLSSLEPGLRSCLSPDQIPGVNLAATLK